MREHSRDKERLEHILIQIGALRGSGFLYNSSKTAQKETKNANKYLLYRRHATEREQTNICCKFGPKEMS